MTGATAALKNEITDHRKKALLDVIRQIHFSDADFADVMQQAYSERYAYCHTPKGMEKEIEELETSNRRLREQVKGIW